MSQPDTSLPRKKLVERGLIGGLFAITLVSVLLVNFGSDWTWETPVDRTTGTITVKVDPSMDVLRLTPQAVSTKEIKFALARDPRAVRAWQRQKLADRTEMPDGLWLCGAPSSECRIDNDTLEIKVSNVIRQDATSTQQSSWVTLWLLPYHTTDKVLADLKTYHVPTGPLRWRSIEVRTTTNRKVIDAVTCSESSQEDACLVARGVLGNPRRVAGYDPQEIILGVAEWASTYAIPPVVWVMISLNIILAGAIAVLLGAWIRGKGLDSNRGDVHASTVLAESRRFLEWLEVLGPAVAFAATVLGLILAFAPSVYVGHDSARFAAEISLAMTATFCGLLMRILSFTADRIIIHLAYWNADRDGFLGGPVDIKVGADDSKPTGGE